MPFDIKTQLYLISFIEFAFLLQVFEHKEARSGKVCPVKTVGHIADWAQEICHHQSTIREHRAVPFPDAHRNVYYPVGKCENVIHNS